MPRQAFNEDSRVKIPAILHLVGLGYQYLSVREDKAKFRPETNIHEGIFEDSIKRINPGIKSADIRRLLDDITLKLDNDDLGSSFFEMLLTTDAPKLIDFANFSNNAFHVATELTCQNGEDEFRPDITLFINGMPLSLVEVKKPNNPNGILAERERIDRRFQNRKFRRFINISQVLVFSNNMEYAEDEPEPLQGAFYCTAAREKASFNYFREEDDPDQMARDVSGVSEDEIDRVLADTGAAEIKFTAEFATNRNPLSPTNRLLTSLFQFGRIAFLLQYAFAYVTQSDGSLEKHIMRYPQFFAARKIVRKVASGMRRGIVWHTQGSGKTALAFYCVKLLTHHFRTRRQVPKFYFIVDRLDLLKQASLEFASRGLVVHKVNTRDEFVASLGSQGAIHNPAGKPEITVVNIQKFSDDAHATTSQNYETGIQRVYFIDEAHRSYKPTGSFLANLLDSDRLATHIGLTGTPLLGEWRSTAIFGDYIHTYYYNQSIKDGYTRRLIREGIETTYQSQLQEALKEIKILKGGDAARDALFSHPRFVEPMLKYIVDDLVRSRFAHGDSTIGGMVVCASADQAREMKRNIDENKASPIRAALILHDEGDKESRDAEIAEFKAGKIDLLIVFNMLLTGFDAPRLKKLYLGRVLQDHNLLQTLTRVNRPYKKFRFGYVVDFADIRKAFDAANKAYLEELQKELGDQWGTYDAIFMSREEIEKGIARIRSVLALYDTDNAENFSRQVSEIQDRKTMLEVKGALDTAKELYGVIRCMDYRDLRDRLDFEKLNLLCTEATNRMAAINLSVALQSGEQIDNLLGQAIEKMLFSFKKIGEAELKIADEFCDALRGAREGLNGNFDRGDPEWVALYEELKRILAKRGVKEMTPQEIQDGIPRLKRLRLRAQELNRRNHLLRQKYGNDWKFVRLHKRLMERDFLHGDQSRIIQLLFGIKREVDGTVLRNRGKLDNEGAFKGDLYDPVCRHCAALQLDSAKETQTIDFIVDRISDEYRHESAAEYSFTYHRDDNDDLPQVAGH